MAATPLLRIACAVCPKCAVPYDMFSSKRQCASIAVTAQVPNFIVSFSKLQIDVDKGEPVLTSHFIIFLSQLMLWLGVLIEGPLCAVKANQGWMDHSPRFAIICTKTSGVAGLSCCIHTS